MTIVQHGRLAHVVKQPRARHSQPVHHGRRTELVVSIVLAAWVIVLLCGYIAGAVP
ncbi:MAG: hypothetical protein JO044_11975 [Mycobacteriaceae bacterium]|nr:hypothetical protein [Mycobacteriaceae bacterium]MBV9638685.1 hypothetical protein [Mycobacteriaceae bacterium]